GEYLEFLNALAVQDPDEASLRSPRYAEGGKSLLTRTPEGRLALPEDDPELGPWQESWPVFGISLLDAESYCAWRSSREGILFRLPAEEEWEKACRGVDGRRYPWGNRFDASLCNMSVSFSRPPRPAPIDAFPADSSVYGVRGMAGNISEWTSTRIQAPGGKMKCVVRGGHYQASPEGCSASYREWRDPAAPGDTVGFRLAWTAGQRLHPGTG
ncbi:formylglycine-generating enzyme family protein, partial [Acidobacteriota bacterium]